MNTENTNKVLTQADEKIQTENRQEVKTLTKTEKLYEKLKALSEKREKAFSAQSAAEKKTKEIDEQITKIRTELHNDEIRSLDNLCRKCGFTIRDVHIFLSALIEKMTLPEAAALLDIKIQSGGIESE